MSDRRKMPPYSTSVLVTLTVMAAAIETYQGQDYGWLEPVAVVCIGWHVITAYLAGWVRLMAPQDDGEPVGCFAVIIGTVMSLPSLAVTLAPLYALFN